jgi:hypothetical protein
MALNFYPAAEIAATEPAAFNEADDGWYGSLTGAERAVVDRLNRYNRNRNRAVATRMAWPELVRLEPRLADLEARLAAVEDAGGYGFCANAVWYGHGQHFSYRDALSDLAGWQAERPALRTAAAYDLAYEYLYELLPDCRDCVCM